MLEQDQAVDKVQHGPSCPGSSVGRDNDPPPAALTDLPRQKVVSHVPEIAVRMAPVFQMRGQELEGG